MGEKVRSGSSRLPTRIPPMKRENRPVKKMLYALVIGQPP